MWDRSFGGTTLVIHVEGTTRPGSPKRPEFVKADVYFPGYFLQLNNGRHYSNAVSEIVQRFILDIGLPTIERYETCAIAARWITPTSRSTPLPYAQQSFHPPADPATSSNFIYHGRPPVVVIDDYDDEDNSLIFTASQIQLRSENESLLKAELETAKEDLKQTQDALAESQRREQDLLAQIDHLTNGSASLPSIPTSIASQTVPRTPEHVNVNRGRHPRSQNARDSPLQFFSPVASPSRRVGGSSFPALSCGADRVPVMLNVLTSPRPVTLSPGTMYSDFVHANGLDDVFSHIDVIRRNVAPFLWKDELEKIPIDGDKVIPLMAVMATHSIDILGSSGTGASPSFFSQNIPQR